MRKVRWTELDWECGILSNTKKNKPTARDGDSDLNWLNEAPLGEALRKQYQDTLNDPLPPKLKALIDELKRKETDR